MKKKNLTNEIGEVRELIVSDIRAMRPGTQVLPIDLVKILPKRQPGQRGPQKVPVKIAVTLRYSPEVLDYFKKEGYGWQTRMDQALKAWIKKHPRAA